MDEPIGSLPGMEKFLRRRDLPSFFRVKQLTDSIFQIILNQTLKTPQASALILNTFEDLDGPILSHIRDHCRTTYAIGPLHSFHQSKHVDSPSQDSGKSAARGSLWSEDATCMSWLDLHPPKSVLYVSFGSYAEMTRGELMEFWYGLVNSRRHFLWVVRQGLVSDDREVGCIPTELEQGTRERGFLVGWAPQEEVLAHEAVGGFLTHGGWNSTLESVAAGVPMLCWPYFADQQINSRYVAEVWRVGLDMKDQCDREVVERMVRELMEGKISEKLQEAASSLAALAKKAVAPGGSSYACLEGLIDDIKSGSFQRGKERVLHG